MSKDIFQKDEIQTDKPLTSDYAQILWDGAVIATATGVSIQYARGVNRHRTIGNKTAVISTTQPSGQISIGQLVTEKGDSMLSRPGWDGCSPTRIVIQLGGCGGTGGKEKYTALGCVVSSFAMAMEAENVTIMQNVQIDFLQLQKG